jgi:cytochrome c peroxidase
VAIANLLRVVSIAAALTGVTGCLTASSEDVDVDADVELADEPVAEANAELNIWDVLSQLEHKLLAHEVRDLAKKQGVTALEPPPPASPELVALGEALFYDKILSGNRDVSCSSCHHPRYGTADGRTLPSGARGTGIGPDRRGGVMGGRTTQPIWNLHKLMQESTYDGKAEVRPDGRVVVFKQEMVPFAWQDEAFAYGAVSAQAMFPVQIPGEMLGYPGENELSNCPPLDLQCVWTGLMRRLGAVDEYVAMFEAAYPGKRFVDMNFAFAGNAIAAYEIQAFYSNDSPWDRFVGRWDVATSSFKAGRDSALTTEELRGARRFLDTNRSNCVSCHSGSGLSDQGFHKTASPQFGPGNPFPGGDGPGGLDDFGRMRVTGDEADKYAWRTASLRNIELTAPYGRVGQYEDLADFVRHYKDPERALLEYDVADLGDESLDGTMLNNKAEILASGIDPELDHVRIYSEQHVNQLVAFLGALTDRKAGDFAGLTPDRVPSGLPVDQ